ncbi:MAG: hypothetical protein PHV07_09360 [Oscillospiraceae bacterium]|nr:hypothetical protein [Oscillospiraceae bacterium]
MAEQAFLTYRGKPLVRKDNVIYYGNMSDKYVIMLQIVSTQKVNDLDVAEKVLVQLMYTDPELRTRDRVVKKSEKIGLYNAMDIGSIWLERSLKNG